MMNWCSKHDLFEICPECMREQREEREHREWCLRMAKLEGDASIGAGSLAIDPCFENDRGAE